jgi:hypothetical protein
MAHSADIAMPVRWLVKRTITPPWNGMKTARLKLKRPTPAPLSGRKGTRLIRNLVEIVGNLGNHLGSPANPWRSAVSRSSAAGGNGPFWTAESAASNCCGVAMPTRIVPVALEPLVYYRERDHTDSTSLDCLGSDARPTCSSR